MSWVKLSDTFADDPLLEEAGTDAFVMHVAALCYCSRQLTNGHISIRAARRLWSVDSPDDAIKKLVEAGKWIEHDDGYELAGYLDDQPSAEKVRHEQRLKADRQARWRDGKTGRRVDASTDASRNRSNDAHPAPPRPAPKEAEAGGVRPGSAGATPTDPTRGKINPTRCPYCRSDDHEHCRNIGSFPSDAPYSGTCPCPCVSGHCEPCFNEDHDHCTQLAYGSPCVGYPCECANCHTHEEELAAYKKHCAECPSCEWAEE